MLGGIGKRTSLDFVSEMPRLRSLSVALGGRASIAQIEAPGLRELAVIRVQGLVELGDLSRFQELTSLAVEDQASHRASTVLGARLEARNAANPQLQGAPTARRARGALSVGAAPHLGDGARR